MFCNNSLRQARNVFVSFFLLRGGALCLTIRVVHRHMTNVCVCALLGHGNGILAALGTVGARMSLKPHNGTINRFITVSERETKNEEECFLHTKRNRCYHSRNNLSSSL